MVYSAITGGKDEPRDDVLCFTEYDRFKDQRLNAKIYKVLPHLFLPNEPWWIWVDGNLTLKVPEEELIELAGESEVAVFENPYRKTVGEEKEEVIRLGLDTEENVKKHPLNNDGRLPACFLIVRKNTEAVRRMNERWWALITTGSVRDQISFTEAFPTAKFLPKVHPFDNKYFTRKGHSIPR